MPNSVDENEEHEQQLDALIAEYYRAEAAGKAPDHNEFIAQHPDFAKELTEFFADVLMLNGQDCPDPQDPALEPTITAGTSQRKSLAAGAVVRYFGVYEILEELGSGGMGVVYKARHARLRKFVALKMIRARELATEFEVRMFEAEARAAAKLDHPNIVAVHEVGVHADQHFYSMDYVAGGSLSRLHRDEPVPAKRTAELVKQLAEAIHYAHGQGIVHRDLKPANVLLTADGVPRITDFGLAKRLWAGDDSMALSMTETGQILGTAGYMSPEQAEGKTKLVGPPADIYALGAVLYALLTSRAPFIGESQADTIRQVIEKEPVSPRVLNPSLPRDLETICLKCLNKERHERYGTAQLLADDLERFLEGRPVLARPISSTARVWRWCRRNVVTSSLIAMSAIFLLVVVVLITVGYVTQSQHALELEAENSRTKQNLYFGSVRSAMQEVHNGDFKTARVLLEQAPAEYRHWEWYWLMRQCNGYSKPVDLPGTIVPVFCRAYSPDGRLLAVLPLKTNPSADEGELELRLIDVASGSEVYKHRGVFLAYAPDARTVAFASRSGAISLTDIISGEKKRSYQFIGNIPLDNTSRPFSYGDEGFFAPCFSPDGSFVVGYEFCSKITLWPIQSEEPYLEISLPLNLEKSLPPWKDFPDLYHDPLWTRGSMRPDKFFSPDGKWLAFPSASDPTAISLWNLENRSVDRELKGHSSRLLMLEYSPDGSRLASVDTNGVAKIWDPATGETVFETVAYCEQLRFSHDGSLLAVLQQDGLLVYRTTDGRQLWGRSGLDLCVRGNVEFLNDSSLLVVADCKNAIHVFDPGQGTELLVLDFGYEVGFTRLEASPSSNSVAVSVSGKTSALDLSQIVLGSPDRLDEDSNEEFEFSSDGTLIWTVLWGQKEVQAWDVVAQRMILQTKAARSLLSPDRFDLAASYEDATKIWSLRPTLTKSDGATRLVHTVAAMGRPLSFSVTRRRLISEQITQTVNASNGHGGRFDKPLAKEVSVWSFDQPSPLLTFAIRSSPNATEDSSFLVRQPDGLELASNIIGVICSDDARYLVTLCGSDVHLWDCEAGRRIAVLNCAATADHAVFAPGGAYLATSCQIDAGTSDVCLWDSASGQMLHRFSHPGKIKEVQFNANSSRLLCHSTDQIQLWSIPSGRLLSASSGPDWWSNVVLSPDDECILNRLMDGDDYRLTWVDTGKIVTLPGSTMCENFSFSPDNSRLIAMHPGGSDLGVEVRMFDTGTGTEVFRWSVPADSGRGANTHPQFSPDGSQILVGKLRFDSLMKSN